MGGSERAHDTILVSTERVELRRVATVTCLPQTGVTCNEYEQV